MNTVRLFKLVRLYFALLFEFWNPLNASWNVTFHEAFFGQSLWSDLSLFLYLSACILGIIFLEHTMCNLGVLFIYTQFINSLGIRIIIYSFVFFLTSLVPYLILCLPKDRHQRNSLLVSFQSMVTVTQTHQNLDIVVPRSSEKFCIFCKA